MDPVTHSVFAVCCAVTATRHPESRRAAAVGGLAGGLWPDADIFLRSATDPLFQIEYHRHFTHGLGFSPVLMLIAAASAWGLLRLFRTRAPFRSLLWPALLGIWSHIFCDLWTSYGTRALWPFSNDRLSLDWISVVDPLMTVPLLVFAVAAIRRRSRKLAVAGLAWTGLYLILCITQQHRAESALAGYITSRGHTAARINVKPSFGNIVVWRGTWLSASDHQYHAVAIRPGWPGDVRVKPGESLPMLEAPIGDGSNPWHEFDGMSTTVRDVRRFYHFSDGWVAWIPGQEGRQLGDMRYSAAPDRFQPMWGIGLHASQPDRHADWLTFRSLSRDSFAPLWELICGRGF